jgi:hypothetical protein
MTPAFDGNVLMAKYFRSFSMEYINLAFSSIDSETGLITSNTNKLDRETLDRYYLPVVAYDNGVNSQSSTATVTIVVTDENDERPYTHISINFIRIK